MTLEETRRQQAVEGSRRESGITDEELIRMQNRMRDLSAHEQAAVEQRQRSEALQAEVAAIAAEPSESARELYYRILDLRREIQTMSDGRGVQFEFRRRLAILQAYEGKLAAIDAVTARRLAYEVRLAAIEERRPGTLRDLERYSIDAADTFVPSVDPEHQSAYQRLLAIRAARGMVNQNAVDSAAWAQFQGQLGIMAMTAISEHSLSETFVSSVTVTPSPQQAEAEMMYYSGNAFPASGMVAPMPISPPSQELTAWFQRLQEGWVQVGAAPTPTPAPVAPPPNPLHSITPLPRKIVMDRS